MYLLLKVFMALVNWMVIYKIQKKIMMRKILYITSIAMFCLMFSLTSCNEDEQIENSIPSKENTWYWGYFKGVIDGVNVTLENKDLQTRPIRSVTRELREANQFAFYVYDYVGAMINYNDRSVLNVSLSISTIGERYLDSFYKDKWNENSIYVVIYASPSKKLNEQKAIYVPIKDHPFRANIIDLTWLSESERAIEVELDGLLQNINDPNDTLCICGTYGIRR